MRPSDACDHTTLNASPHKHIFPLHMQDNDKDNPSLRFNVHEGTGVLTQTPGTPAVLYFTVTQLACVMTPRSSKNVLSFQQQQIKRAALASMLKLQL